MHRIIPHCVKHTHTVHSQSYINTVLSPETICLSTLVLVHAVEETYIIYGMISVYNQIYNIIMLDSSILVEQYDEVHAQMKFMFRNSRHEYLFTLVTSKVRVIITYELVKQPQLYSWCSMHDHG